MVRIQQSYEGKIFIYFKLNFQAERFKVFESCGFFYAKPLIEGPLEEVLKYNIETNSVIPKLLGNNLFIL